MLWVKVILLSSWAESINRPNTGTKAGPLQFSLPTTTAWWASLVREFAPKFSPAAHAASAAGNPLLPLTVPSPRHHPPVAAVPLPRARAWAIPSRRCVNARPLLCRHAHAAAAPLCTTMPGTPAGRQGHAAPCLLPREGLG
jgi:hypothetical protein